MSMYESYIFFDNAGAPVQGHRHINPDGTLGGWVAETASVPASVFVHESSKVGPGMTLPEDAVVDGGRFVEAA